MPNLASDFFGTYNALLNLASKWDSKVGPVLPREAMGHILSWCVLITIAITLHLKSVAYNLYVENSRIVLVSA